jgi:hypothetical protein
MVMQDNAAQRARQSLYYVLQGCPTTGPAIIARRWRRPPPDSAALIDLVGVSDVVLDERIFDALLEVVSNRGQRRNVRLAALESASHYADTTKLLILDDPRIFRSPGVPRELWWVGFSVASSHLRHYVGSQPLTNVRARLIAFLDTQARLPGEDDYFVALFQTLAIRFKQKG